jgi:hypothetical protein
MTTRRRKIVRSVARRRAKPRKSQLAKRTHKRKFKNMKGGAVPTAAVMMSQPAVKPKTINMDGLVIKKKFKITNRETGGSTLLHTPVCYIIRERFTIGKDSIYLLFRVNCNILVLKEIVRIALGLDTIEQIPSLLLTKITEEEQRTIDQNDDVRTLFIKIYDSDMTRTGLKYKNVSTGNLPSGNLADESKYQKPISNNIESVHTLTESEQASINNADAIMERLRSKLSEYPNNTFECTEFVIPPNRFQIDGFHKIPVDMLLIRDLDYAYMLSTRRIENKCDTTGSNSEFCQKNRKADTFIHTFQFSREYDDYREKRKEDYY